MSSPKFLQLNCLLPQYDSIQMYLQDIEGLLILNKMNALVFFYPFKN